MLMLLCVSTIFGCSFVDIVFADENIIKNGEIFRRKKNGVVKCGEIVVRKREVFSRSTIWRKQERKILKDNRWYIYNFFQGGNSQDHIHCR